MTSSKRARRLRRHKRHGKPVYTPNPRPRGRGLPADRVIIDEPSGLDEFLDHPETGTRRDRPEWTVP